MIEKNAIDHNIKNAKLQGLFGKRECTVTHCSEKDKNQQLQHKIRVLESDLSSLRRSYEVLKDKLAKNLKAKDKEELYREILEKEEIQKHEELLRDEKRRTEALLKRLEALQKEYEDYRKRNEQVLTSFEADQKIQKKIQEIKELQRERDLLLVENSRLKQENFKVEMQYEQLVKVYNSKVAELESLHNEIYLNKKNLKELELVQKKGLTFKPVKIKHPKHSKSKRKVPKIIKWLLPAS